MNTPRSLGLVCIATIFVLTASANAATLWDQSVNPSLSGAYSEIDGQHIADDFHLTAQSTLETISWNGYYDSPQSLMNPVSFTIRFFSQSGVSPEIPVESPFQEYDVSVNAVPTGDIVAGFLGADTPLLSYTVPLSPLALEAGAYWVSILEADTRTPLFHPNQWLWSRSDFDGDYAVRGGSFDTWTSCGSVITTCGNFAVTLTGTVVPLPLPLYLFGSGLLGLVAISRRRKAA